MKKDLILFLVLLMPSSVLLAQPTELGFRRTSGSSGGGLDDLAYSQTYDFGLLQNGYSNYAAGDRWACDDFIITTNHYRIEVIYVWMIWTGEQGSFMNFVISIDDTGDSNPNTNIDFWSGVVPCTNTFTGDVNWGYDIYETYCMIPADAYPELWTDVHYYFETQADVVDNCFILISPNMVGDYCWYNDGSGVWVRSDVTFGEDSDMFFDLFGSPYIAIESETWGSIKALF